MEEDREQTAAEVQAGEGQPEQENKVITVVLTANNHLGYDGFAEHPRKREESRQWLRRAFQQAVDFAAGQGVDLFVQAGDLFDTPNPDEEDRSFVAACLAQLRQVGVRCFAVGGVHNTPVDVHVSPEADGVSAHTLAPLVSYARLGALHYFSPGAGDEGSREGGLRPAMVDVRGVLLGICGLGVPAEQREGDPLAHVCVEDDIGRADVRLLVLHAPIEGLESGSSLLDMRVQVSRASIENQSTFRYILAGYHHAYRHVQIGQCDVIVAGTTQHVDVDDPGDESGFVFVGLAADGIRWCRHIAVDALQLRRLVIRTGELWPEEVGEDRYTAGQTATERILERLRPLCRVDTIVQLQLEGELTRDQYHALDLNPVRHYGEEHCFALTIDDRNLTFLSGDSGLANGQEVATVVASAERSAARFKPSRPLPIDRPQERFSPREELAALADEWIAAAPDEQERKALQVTKEELLVVLDEMKR